MSADSQRYTSPVDALTKLQLVFIERGCQFSASNRLEFGRVALVAMEYNAGRIAVLALQRMFTERTRMTSPRSITTRCRKVSRFVRSTGSLTHAVEKSPSAN